MQQNLAKLDFRSSSLAAKEPYHIPGYAGHKPQYVFQCGNTFGMTTHKLLKDGYKQSNSTPILQPINKVRPNSAPGSLNSSVSDLLDTLNNGKAKGQLFQPQMRSGYMGHVPGVRFSTYHGKSYPNICDDALTAFSINQLNYRKKLEEARLLANNRQRPLQEIKKMSAAETSSYRPPLRVIDTQTVNRSYGSLQEQKSPYFMKDNPAKYFKSGFAGHVPFYKDHGGKTYTTMTNQSLNFFTEQREKHRQAFMRPISAKSIKTSLQLPLSRNLTESQKIYTTGKGIIPKYSGFVPGEKFRHGQRFTASTKNIQI